MATDFKAMLGIRWEDVREACEESLDDLHTDQITFVRDDAGDWYAKATTDQGSHACYQWFKVEGAIPDELDGFIEVARNYGSSD